MNEVNEIREAINTAVDLAEKTGVVNPLFMLSLFPVWAREPVDLTEDLFEYMKNNPNELKFSYERTYRPTTEATESTKAFCVKSRKLKTLWSSDIPNSPEMCKFITPEIKDVLLKGVISELNEEADKKLYIYTLIAFPIIINPNDISKSYRPLMVRYAWL